MIRSIAIGIAAVLAHSAFTVDATAKPVQWKKSQGGNNHWYEAVLVASGIGWVEANLRATTRGCGWHLATITSSAEDKFAFELIAGKDEFFDPDEATLGPWLGGFQRSATDEPTGQWRWVTAEKFNFSNWADEQPDNYTGRGTEDFLHFYRVEEAGKDTSAWNDLYHNYLLRGYIAELEVPRPKSCRSQ